MSENFDYLYINSQKELDYALEKIKRAKVVAFDSEFYRQSTYFAILAIIQIAFSSNESGLRKKNILIIDCLSGLDLSGIFALIFDKNIIKIFHSSQQDLQIFCHEFSKIKNLKIETFGQPKAIMDTQLMANFCGFGLNVGYSTLVQKLFSKTIDKSLQNSDWRTRPLSKKHLEYAALDVFFLEEIYEKFLEILQSKNRFKNYLQEMDDLVFNSLNQKTENLWRKISFKNKNQLQIEKIKKLTLWREKYAKEIDLPRQHLLRDEEIEKIFEDASYNKKNFGNRTKIKNKFFALVLRYFFNSFSKKTSSKSRVKNRLKSKFNLSATALNEFGECFKIKDLPKILEKEGIKSLQNENHENEINILMSEEQKKLFREAKKIISKIAEQENFSEQFLITSSNLKKIIHDNNLLTKIIFGWRYDLFGQEIKSLITNSK